ncbi:FliG C-terminal domain-containing protein [Aquisalinus flavus]|uniref:Flagellar motor switch protein FliG n=1 Tax=Aquisalinus flavus TaxID=1526572 RepID=A0A8J2V586_9PROT|nr:FliG C-terminal domain-containing protein [Aquisalinus flavus]MBD0425243.1 hypothetical protein [Aquisalinus flavus]UNE49099.1 hypothetical protein FF099_14080 [Aquisalinus flavus]GGD17601.1 flagellar motor switch protein FliG [Aquisalinus flavus]
MSQNAVGKPIPPGARTPALRGNNRNPAARADDPEGRLARAQAGARALTPQQRAAIVIALLGPESAGPVVEKIEDRHLKAFYQSYEGLSRIPREVLLATVADFVAELKNLSGTLKGGKTEARELTAQLFDAARSARIFGGDINAKAKADIWLRLAREKAGDLAVYLSKKRPQIIAIVLGQMPNALAGEVLAELPEELTSDVVRRLSKPVKVDEDTLRALGDVMEAEYYANDTASDVAPDNPLATVSSILSVLPGNKRETILKFLAEKEPQEAERIRQTMLTFEGLATRISRTSVPTIFRQMEPDQLLLALKLAATNAPETLEFFYSNVSKRMVEQYKEQIEELGPVKKKDAESAQAAMMSLIARLEKDGEIELIRQETEEEGDEEERI